jgi:hypothetical protein
MRLGEDGLETLPVILVVEDDQLVQSVVEESLSDGPLALALRDLAVMIAKAKGVITVPDQYAYQDAAHSD